MNIDFPRRPTPIWLFGILILSMVPSLYAQENGAEQPIRELRDANAIIVTMKNGKTEAFTVKSVFIEQLDSSNLRKELEIVRSQVEKIDKAKSDSFDKAIEIVREWKESGEATAATEVRETLSDIAADLERRVFDKVLLPRQVLLLKKYPLYLATQKCGLYKMVACGPLGVIVKIRDDQRASMVRKAKVIHDRLKTKIREMEQDAIEEILSVLDNDQKHELLEIRKSFGKNRVPNLNLLMMQLDEKTNSSCDVCDQSLFSIRLIPATIVVYMANAQEEQR